jgi:hypothetical protein
MARLRHLMRACTYWRNGAWQHHYGLYRLGIRQAYLSKAGLATFFVRRSCQASARASGFTLWPLTVPARARCTAFDWCAAPSGGWLPRLPATI